MKMNRSYLNISVLSLTLLGFYPTLSAQIGQPSYDMINQVIYNREHGLAKDCGTVTILNSTFLNNAGKNSGFAEACGPLLVTNSTITNSGDFGKGAYYINVDNSDIKNINPGELAIGMNNQPNLWSPPNQIQYYGTLTISGTSNVYNSGRLCEGKGYFIHSEGTVFNDEGQMCLGMTEAKQTAGVFINDGEFARGSQLVSISGGSITNRGAFATLTGTLSISGSAFFKNLEEGTLGFNVTNYLNLGSASIILNEGQIGPAGINFNGANLVNNGEIYVGKLSLANYSGPFGSYINPYFTGYNAYDTPPTQANPSHFISGTIQGNGDMYFSGTVTANIPMTQANFVIGKSFAGSSNFPCDFIHTNTLEGNVFITETGALYSTGTVIGSVEAAPNARLSPGGIFDLTDSLKISGDLILSPNSFLTLDFDNNGSDKVVINDGNLYLGFDTTKPILNLFATGLFESPSFYPLIDLRNSGSSSNLENQEIFGDFTVVKTQPLLNFNVGYTPSLVYMWAGTNPFGSLYSSINTDQFALYKNPLDFYAVANDYNDPFSNGYSCLDNKISICKALDELNGNTNPCLQSKINQLLLLTGPQLDSVFSSLDPAEFKGQQIVLEELVFATNEELINQLQLRKKGVSAFVIGGYRHFDQLSYNYHNGFKANTGFEGLGITYGKNHYQLSVTAGALETKTHYKHIQSKSSSASVFGQIGAARDFNRWQLGADVMFTYNFINTSRTIGYFNLPAVSNHGGSISKGGLFAAYTKKEGQFNIRPYDKFYYMYNYENAYHEHGASCLSTNVKSSNREVIRNDIGFYLEYARDQKIKPYIDLSYVYEYRWQGDAYKLSFVNTDVTFSSQGPSTSRNFAKYAFGLVGSAKNWDYKLNLDGMYSSKLKEAGVNASLSKKF